MPKFIFFLAAFLPLSISAQVDKTIMPCSYCTNIEEALVKPSQVTYLNLRASGLTKIPEDINEFVNLKTLDLCQNLINEIDFTSISLMQLEELNLSNNPGFDALSIEGIAEALPNLKSIDLSECQLVYISKEISQLKKLRELNVSNNVIRFLPTTLNQLTSLDVSQNELQDTYCLIDSWDLESLDISGNPELDVNKIDASLKYKEKLQELTISPDPTLKKSLPASLAEIPMEQLTLKDGKIYDPNFQISKNTSINKIVLDNIEVGDPERFKNWINRFESLDEVEFRNMMVPEYLDQINSMERMNFVNAEFQDKMELRNIKSTIQLKAQRTDIRTEGYIGNSKIVNLDEPVVEERSVYALSPGMRNNELAQLVEPEMEEFSFNSSSAQKLTLDYSSFDIPSEAFLTQAGQVYSGDVRVNVTEHMDPIVNALTGVPMTYRTAEEDVVFSSSGMFEFRAYDDAGNELNPNPESPIEVEMKDLLPSQSSDLYKYNDSLRNWELLQEEPEENGWMDRKAELLDSLNKVSDLDITNFYVLPIATLLQYKKSRKDPYVLKFKTLGTSKRVRNEKNFKQAIRTENPDQKWIAKQEWKIDTIIDSEISQALVGMKKAQRKYKKRWFVGIVKRNPDTAPRFLKDLTITPDFDRDNYRMEFTFKGEEMSFPVIQNFSGSLRKIQARERRSFKEYERCKSFAGKDENRIKKYEKTVLKEQAELIRERSSTMAIRYPAPPDVASESLRFGMNPRGRQGFLEGAGDVGGAVLRGIGTILTFGLINVDMQISIPPKTVRMDAVAIDQSGETIKVPDFVRTVFPRSGGYMSVPYSSVLMPRSGKPVILFPMGTSEIAVVRNWKKMKDGSKQATVERISTAGLTPFQIRSLISAK